MQSARTEKDQQQRSADQMAHLGGSATENDKQGVPQPFSMQEEMGKESMQSKDEQESQEDHQQQQPNTTVQPTSDNIKGEQIDSKSNNQTLRDALGNVNLTSNSKTKQ